MTPPLLRTAAAALVVAAALGGCGSSAQTSAPDPASATTRGAAQLATTTTDHSAPASTRSTRPAPPHTSSGAVAVSVAPSTYGPALVDRRGFALYLFTHDRSPGSTCYDACAAAWPPYVVATRPSGAARGARGGRGQRVGTVRRRDGRLQVTYAGHPLYYYVGDRRPGQILCQAVAEFGGTWYVVAPSGHPIR